MTIRLIVFFFYYTGANKSFINIFYILVFIYTLSLFSYNFIEKPFYKGKIITNNNFLLFCSSVILIIFLISVSMVNSYLKPLKANEYNLIKSEFKNNFSEPYRGAGSGTDITVNQFDKMNNNKMM